MGKKKIIIKKKRKNTSSTFEEPIEKYIPPTHNTNSIFKKKSFSSKLFYLITSILIAIGLLFYFVIYPKYKSTKISEPKSKPNTTISSIKELIDKDKYDVNIQIINTETSMYDLLKSLSIPSADIKSLLLKINDIEKNFSLHQGDKVTIFNHKNVLKIIDYIVIESNKTPLISYLITFKEKLTVQTIKKQVTYVVHQEGVVIDSFLWNAVLDANLHYSLTSKMENILKWSIDLHHLKGGDRFKIVYDEQIINNKSTGVKNIFAIEFFHKNKKHTFYRFEHNGKVDYISEFGQKIEKSFLKSPLKYGRLTSRYNLNRLHPVKNKTIPHLGTDYAAPLGTPILAVADGKVTIIGTKKANGNYIKIRHNKTYETQYLHMQRFKDGLVVGSKVKQGDIIGYVGQTGLATGPHVCFRFWKNGKQVDHLNEKLSMSKSISQINLSNFIPIRDSLKSVLEGIDIF